MPPRKGSKKGPDGKFTSPAKDSDKSQSLTPAWNALFVPFGDRLDFLSPERQHLNTGQLKILPPHGLKARNRGDD